MAKGKGWPLFLLQFLSFLKVSKILTDKDGFSPVVFRLRLEQKIPVTVCLVCCVCVLFSKANSKWRTSISYRFITFYSFAPCAAKVPLGQCSRVCCCREISLVNQKLTFDERISCITRHDDFSQKINGQSHCKLLLPSEIAEAIVAIVEPFKLIGKRVNFVIWFKLNSNRDFNREQLL